MSEFSKELQVTAEFCQEHHLNAFAKHIPLGKLRLSGPQLPI